ncbi:hypothetical protein B484DRAFT_429254 [Ochromonadaceae sp. CCMP2298]|nr:hypothetical protein B484DRAFT_429254 [Ochromonadaceae sp. CCMP2298]|mmetsp:Transcript_251/g.523  ORF Transcript_251/g.523 Transcript_251/m.523 type:complete len:351 (-) Transcript_251:362-1414(-)
MNWIQKLAHFLPLCTYPSLLLNSTWTFQNRPERHGAAYPWNECPGFLDIVKKDTRYADTASKFSCEDRPYRRARLHSDGCSLLPLEVSLKALSLFQGQGLQGQGPVGPSTVYVGDSLFTQLYMSATCHLEYTQYGQRSPLLLVHDLFLRNDIPCDARCETNQTFLLQDVFIHPCWACRNGVRRHFSDFDTDADSWHNRLPANVTSLIIGAGAWYNSFQGLLNSSSTYEEMLLRVGPLLGRLRERDIEVFWVGLPPSTPSTSSRLGGDLYDWRLFRDKDSMAERLLTPHGVTFIDVAVLTAARKAVDPSVSADGLHWCGPGSHSVPTFINQVIFHTLVMRKMEATRQGQQA